MDALFGYGSLISADSRARTAASGRSTACEINGLRRAFCVLKDDATMASAAVIADDASRCNGVLFEVSPSQLEAFDQRELPWGYQRTKLEEAVAGFSNYERYVYQLSQWQEPTHTAPIVQSYVDVIIDGALDIDYEFALKFVEQTSNWDAPWINDRQAPRYVRPLHRSERWSQIDAVLIAVLGSDRLQSRDQAADKYT